MSLVSASIAVFQHGKTILEKAYGFANLEHHIPATPATRYFIGSVTKEFVAAAIEQLVDEHRIDLNASAS